MEATSVLHEDMVIRIAVGNVVNVRQPCCMTKFPSPSEPWNCPLNLYGVIHPGNDLSGHNIPPPPPPPLTHTELYLSPLPMPKFTYFKNIALDLAFDLTRSSFANLATSGRDWCDSKRIVQIYLAEAQPVHHLSLILGQLPSIYRLSLNITLQIDFKWPCDHRVRQAESFEAAEELLEDGTELLCPDDCDDKLRREFRRRTNEFLVDVDFCRPLRDLGNVNAMTVTGLGVEGETYARDVCAQVRANSRQSTPNVSDGLIVIENPWEEERMDLVSSDSW